MTWIPALIALAALCTPGDPPTDSSETVKSSPPTAAALLEHVVVVGASASEGFGLRSELGAEAPLALFIDAAWESERTATKHAASSRFFLEPDKAGTLQRDAAKAEGVTLLVAVDFLFWFGYGIHGSEAQRLATLEKGLAMLDEIGGPMLVGDFPDMRPALKGEGMFGGPVISARQIPEPQTIARLNARLDEWSKERPNVMRVPLADFVTRLQTNQELVLRGMRWSPEDCRRLLQKDLLHPTAEGTAALALLCLDSLERSQESITAELVRWDVQAILDGVRTATEAERAAAEAKQAAREERLRKLEERKKAREKEGEDEGEDSGAERDAA
jgi:hypothetical protein